MNSKYIQNEKLIEDVINRLSTQHGLECRKTVEENRQIKEYNDSL